MSSAIASFAARICGYVRPVFLYLNGSNEPQSPWRPKNFGGRNGKEWHSNNAQSRTWLAMAVHLKLSLLARWQWMNFPVDPNSWHGEWRGHVHVLVFRHERHDWAVCGCVRLKHAYLSNDRWNAHNHVLHRWTLVSAVTSDLQKFWFVFFASCRLDVPRRKSDDVETRWRCTRKLEAKYLTRSVGRHTFHKCKIFIHI